MTHKHKLLRDKLKNKAQSIYNGDLWHMNVNLTDIDSKVDFIISDNIVTKLSQKIDGIAKKKYCNKLCR